MRFFSFRFFTNIFRKRFLYSVTFALLNKVDQILVLNEAKSAALIDVYLALTEYSALLGQFGTHSKKLWNVSHLSNNKGLALAGNFGPAVYGFGVPHGAAFGALLFSNWLVVCFRCDNNAQLFHNLKRIPFNVAGGIKPDCHECVGWCVHVFHLRVLIRIRMCELRRKKAAASQRRLPARGKSRDTGQ